ncbi:MAG TPA: hypothetical protein DCS87_11760 [Rheinheimera sp.]|nr:hypothetical protein [Rheinheimera sp.]
MGHYDEQREQDCIQNQLCATSPEASFKLSEAANQLDAAVSCMVRDWVQSACQPADLARAQYALSVLRGVAP